ncbi:MAG: M16 family metallopeptidase [Chakrabartia sp.]
MSFPYLRLATGLATSLSLLLAAPLHAQTPAPAAKARTESAVPWLYRNSDIPVDQNWQFGELPNGLRYAVRRNGVPPGQVSIRVAIDAGSLMESEEERGYAHFLEHLAFRGSRYVADGEAKRVWQRLGATFGNDSNAATTSTQTIFRLDLPQASPQALDESMRILSGMMAAPNITEAEVEAERRTVMAEARERDGAQVRLSDATTQLFFAGQRLADRPPIGTAAALAKARAGTLRAFHDRWYRPDTTVIAISGDADPDVLTDIIARHFADWAKPKNTPLPKVDFGAPDARQPDTRVVVEAGLPTLVSLAWMRPWTPQPDTIALNQGRLIDLVATGILNRRLEQRARAGGSYLQASIDQEDVARSANISFMSILPMGENWQQALLDVRAVIADAIARAPKQSEIDREAVEFKAALDVQVETARAEASAKQADDLIEAVNIRETVASPEVARDVFTAMIGKFGPAEVQKAMVRLFSGIGPRALLSSQTPQPDGAAQLAQALKQPVTGIGSDQDQKAISFDILPALGPPGTIVSAGPLLNVEVETLTLSNGTRVLLGRSTSEAGRIYVSARFGTGRLGLPRDSITPIWTAGALPAAGIGDLGQDTLDRLTSGRQISIGVEVGDDAYFMRAMTRPADLADQLKLMATKFVHPGWDPAPVLRARAAMLLGLRTATSSPGDVLARQLGAILRDGDKRWAAPDEREVDALTPESFRDFWDRILATGPIELSIFGDFDPEAARKAVLDSFGAMPPRPEALKITNGDIIGTARPNGTPLRLTHQGSPDQAIALLSWPTGAGSKTIRTGRQLDMLAAIFNDRLFEQFREGDGASSSPDVDSSWPLGYRSGGSFTALAQVKPDAVDVFFTRARAIAADLAARPVSVDELQRAIGPMRQRLSRASTGNSYWLTQLSGATSEPVRITNLLRWQSDLDKITPRDLQMLAKRYLKPKKSFSLVVMPELKSAPESLVSQAAQHANADDRP